MVFTLENPLSVDEVKTYSDQALTNLIEDLTATVGNEFTGIFVTDEMDPTLYDVGTVYWCKIGWTPVGNPPLVDSFPFVIERLAQPQGTAPVVDKNCDGSHVQTPQVQLRLGRNGFRDEDLEDAAYGSFERYAQQFPLPDNRQAEDLHFIFSAARAGAPMVIEYIHIEGAAIPVFGSPAEDGPGNPVRIAPARGYRSKDLSAEHLLRRSLNISIEGDFPRPRDGYEVAIVPDPTPLAPVYAERLNCDSQAGQRCTAYFVGEKFFDDDSPPATLLAVSTPPYGAIPNPIPRSVLIRGVRLWCDGLEHFVLHRDSVTGLALVKPPLIDPTDPTLAPLAGGTLPDGDRYVRIRWKDSQTNTESGPNSRASTVTPVALASPNNAIDVTRPGPPGRATHWQIQSAPLDTPNSYEIHYDVKSSVGGPIISDAEGWIPIATTSGVIDEPPASGDFFEFLAFGAATFYRHANPPKQASHVVHYKGRAVYATQFNTWLVFSEADNPEHHYCDEDNPDLGPNSIRGEQLVDTVLSPCRCLAAIEDQLLFFTDGQVVVFQGSLQPVFNQQTLLLQSRDIRPIPIGENQLGAMAGDWKAVDQDVYYASPAGPAIYRAGTTALLDPHGIEADWECRERAYDHRCVVGYDPRSRLVFFSYVPLGQEIDGVPMRTLAWSIEKQAWCAPFTLPATAWSLGRYDAGGSDRNVQLFFGGPYGAINRYGYGHGDGADGSDASAADLVSTAATATSATVAGAGWSTDQHKHRGVVLTDRGTGARHYRVVRENDGDTIQWDGNLVDSGAGWIVNLAGYAQEVHTAVSSPGAPFRMDSLRVILQDQASL